MCEIRTPWFTIFRSKRGEIGPGRYWVCLGNMRMWTHESLFKLLKLVVRRWNDESDLVG